MSYSDKPSMSSHQSRMVKRSVGILWGHWASTWLAALWTSVKHLWLAWGHDGLTGSGTDGE